MAALVEAVANAKQCPAGARNCLLTVQGETFCHRNRLSWNEGRTECAAHVK